MANHVNGLDEIDMEYTLDAWGDVPPLHARELYAQYDATRAEFVAPDTCHKLHARIAELERERDAAQGALEFAQRYWMDAIAERDAARQSRRRIVLLARRYCALNQMNLTFFLDSEKLLRGARIERDAANKRAKEYVDVFKRVNAAKRVWRKRAEQAEAKLVEAQSRLIAGAVYEKLDSINYWKTRAEQAEADARASFTESRNLERSV